MTGLIEHFKSWTTISFPARITISSRHSKRARRLRNGLRSQEQLEARVLLAGDLVARWVAADIEVSNGEPIVTWVDSVSGIVGTASGSPSLNKDAFGGRSSVRFDGTDGDDLIRIGKADNPVSGADDFTVAVVFATESTHSTTDDGPWYQHMGLVDSSVGGFDTDWGLALNQSGQLVAGLGGGFGKPSSSVYSTEQALTDGESHIAIVTRQGSTLSLYVGNGASTSIDNANGDPRATSVDLVLGDVQSGGIPFSGEIAEVRIYNGFVNEAEAAALHGEIEGFYRNEPPLTVTDAYAAQEDTLLLIPAANGLLRNDSDADSDPLTAAVIETTQNGTLTVNPDGSFGYAPNVDFFGTDSFTYAANDFRNGNAANVSITVESVNDAPVANADLYFGDSGETISRSAADGLLQNDSDVDSDNLTAELVTNVQNGTLALQPDGSFQYSPNADFRGSDSFTYRTSDSIVQSDVAEVRLFVGESPVRISEFLTANVTSLTTRTRDSADDSFRGDKMNEDWIELQNVTSDPLDISGFHLTDDRDSLTKWQIPNGTVIPASGYFTVFASSRNITDPALDELESFHTNFTLSVAGEYLAVTTPDGTPLHTYDEYSQQVPDVSFGLADTGTPSFLTEATPGNANGGAFDGVVAEPTVSVVRGFHSAPFHVAIETVTPGAEIRYTTDGSAPTENTGLVYTTPVNVTTTTNLRAAAFKAGHIPSVIATNTYIFLGDVVNQGNSPEGYPEMFGIGTGSRRDPKPADYEMDPEITQDPKYRDLMDDALLAVPSISITTSIDNLFDPDIGIYQNSEAHGVEWERPASIEMIMPDGTTAFQIDAGIRIQGGASRLPWKNPKHGFRLKFKDVYGSGDLKYDWFGGDAVDQFDEIVLRAGANQAWLHHNTFGGGGDRERAQYIRDQWVNDTYRAMGNPAPHNDYAHLYVNGLYWGLYNPKERPEADFMASYFGGNSIDYDVLNAGELLDGNTDGWREMLNRRFRNLEDDALYEEFSQLLDLDSFMDYMIMNHYGGNQDWDSHNWYAAQNRGPDGKFIFIPWDGEYYFIEPGHNQVRSREAAPGQMFANLIKNDEFKMQLADRIQEHMFNDGLLTPDSVVERWNARSSQITEAIIGESARWGDYRRDVDPSGRPLALLERDKQWMAERNRLLTEYFPVRTDNVVEQYRRANLFPATPAPLFNVRGGIVASTDSIELTTGVGDVYYTTDGSDPRLPGGKINPAATLYNGAFQLDAPATVRARVLNDTEWSAIDLATFAVDVVPATNVNLRVSEINYNPGDPSQSETAAGFSNNDDFEFIEIMNVSDQRVDLSNVVFVRTGDADARQGIDFAFGRGSLLEARQSLVVAEDVDAFAARYGETESLAGQWVGKLGNGGEQITLMAGDEIIQQFVYADDWHTSTDGDGFTLESVNPAAVDLTQWEKAAGWRPSQQIGGTPGNVAPVIGDSNHDGIFNSSDFILVFRAAEYEDDIPNNSTFEEGDWNGDGDFTTADFVAAFQAGTYVATAKPILAAEQGSFFTDSDWLRKQRQSLNARLHDELFAELAFIS